MNKGNNSDLQHKKQISKTRIVSPLHNHLLLYAKKEDCYTR